MNPALFHLVWGFFANLGRSYCSRPMSARLERSFMSPDAMMVTTEVATVVALFYAKSGEEDELLPYSRDVVDCNNPYL